MDIHAGLERIKSLKRRSTLKVQIDVSNDGNRSKPAAPTSVVSRRRFTISFNSFSAHQEVDEKAKHNKKRHTLKPETMELMHQHDIKRKISTIQRTKMNVQNLLPSSAPSEARREKRAISQWKTLTRELMYCELVSSHTSVCSEGSDPYPARSSVIRQYVLKELISTEDSYSRQLHRITVALLSLPCSVQPVFGAFPRLIRLSRSLLMGLQNEGSVADVFRKLEDEFEIYIRYACSYDGNRTRLLRSSSPQLRNIVDKLVTDHTAGRLELADYMILPIQRIARYCLLLKELKKYTHPMEIEYTKLDVMLKSLTGLALAMNNVQKKSRR
ncbi:hypothetical protein INT43_001260 [Umbelopsis isabellina]|uniref:DH domain-containing protein n=1 Tax=Mortierella isabellina TaxID=91625 RepID=A0A8H7UD73_MORIS|nr:hypothetical protein INT43_001260 [Umbelopsis isabellina]